MCVARISRPGDLCDASGAAQTFEGVNAIWNHTSDFSDNVTGLVSGEIGDSPNSERKEDSPKIPGCGNIQKSGRRYVSKVNFPTSKRTGKSVTHFAVRNLLYVGGIH